MGRASIPMALALAAQTAAASAQGVPVLASHALLADPAAAIETALLRPGEAKDAPAARRSQAWTAVDVPAMGRLALAPGRAFVRARFEATGDAQAVSVPACAGRRAVLLDGRRVATEGAGPVVIAPAGGLGAPGTRHEVVVEVQVSAYERRIACGGPFAIGKAGSAAPGWATLSFESPERARGGGQAAVFVPPSHDAAHPAALLVGTHPWNGSIWTYAAYEELARRAAEQDVVVLLPSGLGNSLYVQAAEEEVVRAMDALAKVVRIDASRVSIFGASMGGAGATTIGLHRPDRFASVTSFFGDSKYDLTTYARAVLGGEAGAHQVDALDVAENARWLDVWLIHGDADRTSPIRQSELLDLRLRALGIPVRFDRVKGEGHSGRIVAERIAAVVDRAATARRPDAPERVSFRSVRPGDDAAYWVRIVRRSPGDAFVDVERGATGVRVRAAENVRELVLARGPLGLAGASDPPVAIDAAAPGLLVRWEGP